jgi:aldose 1-epimerase
MCRVLGPPTAVLDTLMPVKKDVFGMVDGKAVDIYALTNTHGLVVKVTTFGAIVTSVQVPDRNGRIDDVVLGFDELRDYAKEHPYFGATVGRVGNRIRNAAFELEGKSYRLVANDGPHHLHGGTRGWDKAVWSAEAIESPEGPVLRLGHVSRDGDEGYPGTVVAETVYTLTNDDELRIVMTATTDRTTIVNMVHHTYWNLGGTVGKAQGRPHPVTDHHLRLHAARYTPGDPVIPIGVETPVKGTPFDFTAGKIIGQDLAATGGIPVGYDHNFIVDGNPDQIREVARLAHPSSGRTMTLLADQPGVQFYTGNYLDGTVNGKGGSVYLPRTGLCLETQKFPNAVNVPQWKAQVVLKTGQTYKHTMIHRFTTG